MRRNGCNYQVCVCVNLDMSKYIHLWLEYLRLYIPEYQIGG